MTLLLVDGSNILLRCAFGGEIPPETSTPAAIGMIQRAVDEVKASHLIVALDYTDAPSWRKLELPEYKAHRTVSTADWLIYGAAAMSKHGWNVTFVPGFEADDIIATIALRTIARNKSAPVVTPVAVLSNDSDLLPLTVDGVQILKPAAASIGFQSMTAADVCSKFGIPAPDRLIDYKAMVGEPGDNIPGVPGIGAKRASGLLQKFGTLEAVIAAGARGDDKYAVVVHQHAATARFAYRLASLRTDVPLPLIAPQKCLVRSNIAARGIS